MVNHVVNGWTIWHTDVLFFTRMSLFYDLHESDIWEVTEMEVGTHVVYNLGHGTNSHFVSTSVNSATPWLAMRDARPS